MVGGVTSIGLWIFSDAIIYLLGGASFAPAAEVLKWFAPVPLAVALSNIFGLQVMIPNGLKVAFNWILGSAGVIGVMLATLLITTHASNGGAMAVLIVECGVTIAMALYLMGRQRSARRHD
jgi:O-antigen/teichoic acid export membrane protein